MANETEDQKKEVIENIKKVEEESKISEKPEKDIVSEKPGFRWQDIDETINKLEEVKRELQDIKKDFLVIFGFCWD